MNSGSKQPRYRLESSNVPGSLADHFRWDTRGDFPEADRRLMTELANTGTLTTAGFALYPHGLEGPSYVERNGTFYEITIERSGQVTREHWIFWFDLLDDEPSRDAEIYTSSLGVGGGTDLTSTYELSPLDVKVVEDSEGEIPREGSFHDPEGDPPARRGQVFLRRDPSETDLLPEPPFTHVTFDPGDGTRYARAVTERAVVELQQFKHSATAIASSPDEYASYVRETHLAATFEAASLPGDKQEILDTVMTGGGRYNENTPLSDALKTLLYRLGLSDVNTPDDGNVAFSDPAYFRYRDGFYNAELQIFR